MPSLNPNDPVDRGLKRDPSTGYRAAESATEVAAGSSFGDPDAAHARGADSETMPFSLAGSADAQATTDLSAGGFSVEPMVAPAEPRTAPAAVSVPGYRVVREIARGGMGRVLAAVDLSLDRDVALKTLLPGASAYRFLREAKITARLPHPGIPPVHALGTLPDGLPFLAMKLIAGQTLADELNVKTADRPGLLQVFNQVCQAVGFAHSRGVIHRDLKPANIMVGAFGDVQVMDWGLAKDFTSPDLPAEPRSSASEALAEPRAGMDADQTTDHAPSGDSTDHRTQTGSVMGTPAYMAPEQARGEATDARSDVFALGAMLCTILTGEPPFTGKSSLDVLKRAAAADLAEAHARLDGCGADAEVAALAQRCLSPSPADRPANGQAVADELTAYLSGVQERLHQVELAAAASRARAEEESKRRKLKRRLVASVLVLLVAVAVGATLSAFRFRGLSRALESNLYFSDIALADRELLADNLGRAQKLLDDCPPGLRQWEWYYLQRRRRVEPVILRATAAIYSVAFSPDGEQTAAGGADGSLHVLDTRTGKVLKTLSGHRTLVFSVAFSPDGRHLASASEDRTVRLWDLDRATGREEVFRRDGHTGDFVRFAHCLAFSPDGRHLLAGGEDGGAIVWDTADGSEVRRLLGHDKAAVSAAFSPDGRRLATGSRAGGFRIWDARTGQLLRTVGGDGEGTRSVVFSPDGRRLATASHNRTAKVWDATTGALLQTLSGHAGLISGLAFSRDGQRLASSDLEEKTVKIWDPLTGRLIINLRGHTDMCTCVAFSPDGGRLVSASSDRTIRVWDASRVSGNQGRESLNLDLHEEVWSVAFSPDGGSLAVESTTAVRLLDAQTGAPLRTYADHAAIVSAVFSPDGRRLAAGLNSAEGTSIVKVWDVASGVEAVTIRDKSQPLCLAFDPDGRYLLMEGPGRTVTVWDARAGLALGEIGRHDNWIWTMTFSPDGRRLATASNDGTVRVWTWDPARLREMQKPALTLATCSLGFSNRVAFSPDGRRLAAGGAEHTITVWDAKTGAEQQTLRGHSGDVFAVAFDGHGRWLASAGEDTTVRLWDTASSPWKLRHTLRGHTGFVISLAFNRDGGRLVSGSRDGTAKVWDLTRLGKQPDE